MEFMKAIADVVVLKQCETETTTKSGIVLAGAAPEKSQVAEVVLVGPGTDEVKMEVAVGDKVICEKFAGTTVKDGDVEYMIVRQKNILVVVK